MALSLILIETAIIKYIITEALIQPLSVTTSFAELKL